MRCDLLSHHWTVEGDVSRRPVEEYSSIASSTSHHSTLTSYSDKVRPSSVLTILMSFGVTMSGPGMDTSLISEYEASSCAKDDKVFYSWYCASYRAKSVMRRQQLAAEAQLGQRVQ